MRVLLVEDDRMIGEGLRSALRLDGHAVDWVRDVAAAEASLVAERFDLMLLDLGLPATASAHAAAEPGAGLRVLRALRARGDALPVIVLTARDAPGDKVAGLDAGADDYLVKPFDLDELAARMRAVQRRRAGRAAPGLRHADVALDPATHRVTKAGVPVALSAREFAVLEVLMQRPGALLSRAQIEERLYGWGEEIESNAVSVYVHQLRRKLGPDFIRNVRGLGYCVGDTGGTGSIGGTGGTGSTGGTGGPGGPGGTGGTGGTDDGPAAVGPTAR